MMRNRSWLVLAATIVVGGAAGGMLVGCGSAPTSQSSARPSVAQLSDGLTVLDATPDHTLMGFKAHGNAVFIETQVGPLKPEVYRKEFPNEPQYEMDTRVVDEDGRTFTLVIGGDSLIDKNWGVEMKAGEKLPPNTRARSEMFFELAQQAGVAAAALQRPDLSDHIFHVTNATRLTPAQHPGLTDRANAALAHAMAAGAQRPLDSIGYHYFIGELFGKSIYWGIAHHSNVWGWDGNYDFTTSSWTWTNNIISCNHGSCSNDGSMGYQWATYSGGASNFVPAYGGETLASIWSEEPTGSNSTYTGGHGCQTGYNWDTPPGHECNDDSSYELWQIHDSPNNYGYGNSSKGNGSSFCALSGGNGNACACSSSCNSCSGDWSYPPNPG